MPPSTLRAKNCWKLPTRPASMFSPEKIRFPTPMRVRPENHRRRRPTNIWGKPAAKDVADLKNPSST